MSMLKDTIAALATPPGRGGVAVIRISGPLVKKVMTAVLRHDLKPRQATLLPFKDEHNETLDKGIALFFPAPHSLTGEDVLELQGHGGPVVVDLILKRLLMLDVRLARAGEFSERAFLNNKMDLTQAEGIADLINAASKEAARSAVRSLQGEFSNAINQLKEKLIYVRTFIEAAIDFSDEEIDFWQDAVLVDKMQEVSELMAQLISQAEQGHLLQEGIQIAIVGEPNVGKSSLINCLSGKELAIVTNTPGTTRDVLHDQILIDGMPIRFSDTAGLRETTDQVEQEGIRRAENVIEEADLLLLMQSADRDKKPCSSRIVELNTRHADKVIKVENKIDLINAEPGIKMVDDQAVIMISAELRLGIELLKEHIKKRIGFNSEQEGVFVARRRHVNALKCAAECILAAENGLKQKHSLDLIAEELRLAQLNLSEITGTFKSDDLLGHIFSSFCIGK